MDRNVITYIRPLHFVDILCDYGAGVDVFTPHAFGHALHTVANRFIADPEIMLEITFDADEVCGPCVHNIDGVCDNTLDRSYRPSAPVMMRDWDLMINRRWCERLAIHPGDRLTARTFGELLRDRRGDITELFPEILDDRILTKEKNLKEGIRKLLGGR